VIITLYVVAGIIMAVGSLYLAWWSRDFRKFLAGAFFVNSGLLFYLYLADVSVPILGTNMVETPFPSVGSSRLISLQQPAPRAAASSAALGL
jgi:hypothetical protein